jgi:hypothetical protein
MEGASRKHVKSRGDLGGHEICCRSVRRHDDVKSVGESASIHIRLVVVAITPTTLTLRTTKDRRTHIRPVLSFDM